MNDEQVFKIFKDIIVKEVANNNKNEYYEGKVIEVIDENKRARVQIIGGEQIFTFLNKTHEVLLSGDNVRIKAINGNLSNAYIALRYGESLELSGDGNTIITTGTTDHPKLSNLDFANSGHTGFASSAQLSDHAVNSIIHITAAERTKWNAGTGGTADSIDWSKITNKPPWYPPSPHQHVQDEIIGLNDTLSIFANQGDVDDLQQKIYEKADKNTVDNHIANDSKHVSDEEREKWNAGISEFSYWEIGDIKFTGYPINSTMWLLCDHSMLDPDKYSELFNKIGTFYGSENVIYNGINKTLFALPAHNEFMPYAYIKAFKAEMKMLFFLNIFPIEENARYVILPDSIIEADKIIME